MNNYENRVYRGMISHIVKPDMTREQAAIALNDAVHKRLQHRLEIWSHFDGGLRTKLLQAADSELLAPEGACGSYSLVLARCLQISGYNVRFMQMTVNGVTGG